MPARRASGDLPAVAHTAFRGEDGALRYEHCLTRDGFSGPYSILYHLHPPHLQESIGAPPHRLERRASGDRALLKRHYETGRFSARGEREVASSALGWNDDVSVAVVTPTEDDSAYVLDGDADRLFFVAEGTGTLRSVFGDLDFAADDYVVVPRGVLHRFTFGAGASVRLLEVACTSSIDLLRRYRNDLGQLRMDAPLSDRDLRVPRFVGPIDEGIRELRVVRGRAVHRYRVPTSPLDVVGWDGTIHPFAVAIRAFRPRVGAVHLPPDVHGTFEARGVLVSSFVPRPLDFAPGAIPCPYPHSSVDCDELIFYQSGDFLSRRGIARGSVTLHPSGLPHGPIVAAYEASLGRTSVSEIAVMLDLDAPFERSAAASAIEDHGYHASYLPGDSS